MPVLFAGLSLLLAACHDPASDAEPAPSDAAEAWAWVEPGGMRCRDSTGTGYALRRTGSTDLLIMLPGGVYCVDPATCAVSPAHYDSLSFAADVRDGTLEEGLYDPASPFAGWNALHVPYCTGDFHSGNARTYVEGVGWQQFVGYANLRTALEDAAFERPITRVVLAGASAGGFGTLLTYGLVAEHFAGVPVHLLDDAGPAFAADAVLPPALQQCWLDRWGLANALPPPEACPQCRETDDAGRYDGLEHLLPYYARTHPAAAFGLVSYEVDPAIRHGLALAACAGAPEATGPQYRAALRALRDSLYHAPNIGTFFLPGTGHTVTDVASFPVLAIGGEGLAAWVERLASGEAGDISE